MNVTGPPPFLLGAALLFWGWQTGLLPFAVVLAPVLEAARYSGWRWEVSRRDVHRVADLCAVLFVAMTIYVLATGNTGRSGVRTVTVLFQWAPLALVPLVICQLYSVAGRVELSALFWTMRRRVERPDAPAPVVLDLRYPYVVVCVLAASTANVQGLWFYAGASALAGWALWTRRSPRVPVVAWAALLVIAAVAGYAGQVGLRTLQHEIEQMMLEYIFSLRGDTDPFRSSTAIGTLGRLKLSDRIVLRVKALGTLRLPLLLREASYNVYHARAWYAVNAEFTSVPAEGDGGTWRLAPGRTGAPQITVAAYLNGGRGVLPLPLGVAAVDRLPAVSVGHNRLGAVKVLDTQGLVDYTVLTSLPAALDAPPDAGDLRVPPREAQVVQLVVEKLGLSRMAPPRAVATVAAHFAREFRYATWRRERRGGPDALEDFLLQSRVGHCEYFATATALVLRAAGVPTRYAVGYSVHEWSHLENAYVARARHAHSWTLVWLDGRWVDLDTTPPGWTEEERPAALWETASDLWSWMVFEFSRWRWGDGGGDVPKYLAWLLAPLVLVLAWRIYARTRVGRRARLPAAPAGPPGHGREDSEFYLIERRLAESGDGRGHAEPAAAWVRRVRGGSDLEEIVALHDRYRFDPRGLSPLERERLRTKATAWLAAHSGAADEPVDQRAISV